MALQQGLHRQVSGSQMVMEFYPKSDPQWVQGEPNLTLGLFPQSHMAWLKKVCFGVETFCTAVPWPHVLWPKALVPNPEVLLPGDTTNTG